MNGRELQEAFAKLGSTSFSGEVYRHVSPPIDCLSTAGSAVRGGRWNPDRSFPTLYTALSRQTSAAELRRFAQRMGMSVDDFLPRRLCILRVELGVVLDLRDVSALKAVGLTATKVRSDDWSACRIVGEAASRFGFEGLLASSATTIGHALVVFPLKTRTGSSIQTVGGEDWKTEADLP